jgi:hypothetical protein
MIIQENRITENYLRNKSIIVSLKAELIVGRKSYCGIIGSLSENSIYVRITHNEITHDFSIGTVAELTFQLHAGTTLNLACKVMWLYKTPNEGIVQNTGMFSPPRYTSMGMGILNSPPDYINLLSNLG